MSEHLAIDGGAPVRGSLLPYARQSIDTNDIAAVVSVLEGDWLTTGPTVATYENAVADYVGAAYAIALSSATAGLHAAVYALGIGPGDDVIVPAMTFAASANCILYCGGTPVFADIDPRTCLVDSEDIESKISERTKALVTVDFTGQPPDMDAIRSIAQRRNVKVIADAAHSLGAQYRGRPVGSLADATVFSTHPVKPITTGEGGIVVTDNELVARKVRTFRNHGIASDARKRAQEGEWRYDMEFLGYNYRCSDILCALGVSQLKKLPSFLARRREIAAEYDKAFSAIDELEIPARSSDVESAWHLYVLRLHLPMLTVDRGQVFRALRAEGIGVNVHYIPVYWHSYYQSLGYKKGLCPVAEREYERMITLPLWPGMTSRDIADVVSAVCKVINAYRK